MKILVVGAKGMLGGMLVEVLADHKVIAWDREEVDITNRNEVLEKIGELKPEVIINTAAYTDVDKAESEPEKAFLVNEAGVRNLVEIARVIGAKVAHYSTDYVFSGEKEEGYKEDELFGKPLNVYGESKLAGEKVLRESGASYYLIRTAWLYGPNGDNFVNKMLELAQDKEELNVVDDQNGSPTFTKDVAEFTRKLLEENYEPGVYHAVNTGVASWYELAREIFKIAGVDVKVQAVGSEEFPRPAKRPAFSILQNTKGPKMRLWPEALREYIEVYYKGSDE